MCRGAYPAPLESRYGFRRCSGPGSACICTVRKHPPSYRALPISSAWDPFGTGREGPAILAWRHTAGCPSGQWERTVNPSRKLPRFESSTRHIRPLTREKPVRGRFVSDPGAKCPPGRGAVARRQTAEAVRRSRFGAKDRAASGGRGLGTRAPTPNTVSVRFLKRWGLRRDGEEKDEYVRLVLRGNGYGE